MNFVHFTAEVPFSTQVLIHINVRRAMDMGIRFFAASKPSPSITKSADLYSLDSDSPPSQDCETSSLPSPIKSIASRYKNSLMWFVTPGNEFGLLPPECFSKVELVKTKRKILLEQVRLTLKYDGENTSHY
jgi:hypothetical protein